MSCFFRGKLGLHGGENMDKKQDKQGKSAEAVEKGWPGVIITDPQGSYTGRPKDTHEVPVQDVDDL